MRAGDVFSYSFSAIRLRKLRAGLTTLGVVIGIAAIVALLSITQGLQYSITSQLQEGLASDTLIVTTGAGFGLGGGGGRRASSGFNLLVNHTELIDSLENVETSIALIQRAGQIEFVSGPRNVTIVGVDFAQYKTVYSSTFVAENGTVPTTPPNDTIVIGKRVNDPSNNGTALVRPNESASILWVNATTLPPRTENYTGNVTGILQEVGGFGVGGPSDTNVYIPISQAETFFGTDQCQAIIVKVSSSDQTIIDNVTKEIQNAFSNEVTVTSAAAILSLLSNIFSTIQLFLAGIAAISLLVAGIGIMNIMIVSLMERTREIGILKALGMKSRTVLTVFLCESVIIGLIGAVVGLVSGWVLANIVAIIFRRGGAFQAATQAQVQASGNLTITPLLTPTVAILAIAFGVGVSVIFAIYPAWRASKLKPVEALRYE
jgi:putative ABC transport system permease protein